MRSVVVVALLVSFVFAGCASAGPDASDEPQGLGENSSVEATSTTGGIRGVVVDDAVRPLANVMIHLLAGDGAYANTTDDGTFTFSGLAPGTYYLEASRFGYNAVRQSADVVAGEEHPPVTRIQLLRDPSQRAYVNAQQTTGYILCTTSLVLVCAAPDLVGDLIVCGVFGVCTGHLTQDRSGFYLYYEPNATMIQSEMVWDSTQPLSKEITMQMENIEGCEADGDSYIENAEGESPIYTVVNETEVQEGTIGGTCGIWYSFFSGSVQGLPLGFTLQQQLQVFSHEFHGYVPPEGWRLSSDGEPPLPPE